MDKIQKQETVNNLKESFESSDGVVVTHYLGLNTAELTELRVKVGEVGARFCVAKNSLVKLASKDTVYKGLEEYFNGPTALVFSKDPIAGIKVIKKYTEKIVHRARLRRARKKITGFKHLPNSNL